MITLEMINSLKTNIKEKINNLNLENITVCEAMKAILANPHRDWIVERNNECRCVNCDYFHYPSLEMYEWMAWK